MHPTKTFSEFDFMLFMNKFEKDIKIVYSYMPLRFRQKININKFANFCYFNSEF